MIRNDLSLHEMKEMKEMDGARGGRNQQEAQVQKQIERIVSFRIFSKAELDLPIKELKRIEVAPTHQPSDGINLNQGRISEIRSRARKRRSLQEEDNLDFENQKRDSKNETNEVKEMFNSRQKKYIKGIFQYE